MQVSFRTSKGICQGTVEGGKVTLDEPSHQILSSLFVFCNVYFEENGWVSIELHDEYYGDPEYQAQEFTPEEIMESRQSYNFTPLEEKRARMAAEWNNLFKG